MELEILPQFLLRWDGSGAVVKYEFETDGFKLLAENEEVHRGGDDVPLDHDAFVLNWISHCGLEGRGVSV